MAITRAERYLFLMDSEGTSQNGMQKLVSRFIEEIGEQNFVRIGQIPEDLRQESRSYAAKLDREIEMEREDARKAGDVVEHHIFGKGTIERVDAKRASYLIRFEKFAQPRNISIRYFSQEHEDLRQKYMKPEEVSDSTVHAAESTDRCEAYRAAARPDEDTVRESDLLQIMKRKAPNLWKRDDVPHDGWTCSGVEDLGAPAGICEMCGYQIIRYAHHMEHPRYRSLTAGCVCAGKMEGDIEAARRREAEYKNRAKAADERYDRQRKGVVDGASADT